MDSKTGPVMGRICLIKPVLAIWTPLMNFISIRLDPGYPLTVPRYYMKHRYRAVKVKIGPKMPYFPLNR